MSVVLENNEQEVIVEVIPPVEVPKSHQEICKAFNPVFDASRILSELLLKYSTDPREDKNRLMRRILNDLVELRYMLDTDLKNTMKEHFDVSVYHPLEM